MCKSIALLAAMTSNETIFKEMNREDQGQLICTPKNWLFRIFVTNLEAEGEPAAKALFLGQSLVLMPANLGFLFLATGH